MRVITLVSFIFAISVIILSPTCKPVQNQAQSEGNADLGDQVESVESTQYVQEIPNGFSVLQEAIPSIILDVRYYSEDNFMGVRVTGYNEPVIVLSTKAREALKNVHDELGEQGLGLKIFDAYRPQKAVDHFVRWAEDPADTLTKRKYYPDIPKDRLFDLGYISGRSGHTRGSTVDLTIVNLESGEELDMGSPWDFFGEISHHDSPLVSASQTENRELLRTTMIKYGYRAITTEWWHYTLENEPFPETYFDFDVE